ncbi:MAG: ATP-dependent zinc metalloprotease FtsH [Eubacteriales bacterium]|nr:ATP-dependent zinc metalloprotease FtsH [Eubacteriales bacterium]
MGLIALIIYMITGAGTLQAKPDELDYNSKFLQLVRNTESADTTQKTIKAILVSDRKVYGLYSDSKFEMKDLPKKAEFLSVIPSESTFRADMAAIVFAASPDKYASVDEISSADYGFAYESVVPEESIWTLLLPSILIIGTIVAFYFIMMRAQGGGKQMQNFGKSRARMTVGDKMNVTFADVAGADEEKEELKEIVDFMRAPQRFNAIGARIPKGVLLVGPPGTGKTLLAKAVAGEAKVPFFSISGSDFVEMFVGVGASRVRDLFQTAKRATPAVVFIDEIDAVGRHRGAGMGGGHDEREQTLNQLLVEMDGFAPNEGIIVIAATNRPDILDPALLRPGRFDRQITVSYPDVKGREEILKVHARNKPMGKEVSLATLAKRTPGFTGADLENVLNEAAILAARANLKAIGMTELEEAITRVQMGPEKRSRVITESDKRITAYHESGHAIVALSLEGCDPVHEVSIVPRGLAAGYTMSLPKEDQMHVTKNKLLDNIAMALGGRVAEQLKFHDVSTGAYSDLQRSSEIAKKMVTEYGMSESIGPMFLGGQEEVFIAKDWGHQRNYSESLAAKVDAEVRNILESQYERARAIISEHMEALDRVSEMLIEFERVSGEEFSAVFNGQSAAEILKKATPKRKRKKPEATPAEPIPTDAESVPV